MSRRIRQLRAKVVRAQRAHRNAGPALVGLRRALHDQLRAEISSDRARKTAATSGQLALDLDSPEEA